MKKVGIIVGVVIIVAIILISIVSLRIYLNEKNNEGGIFSTNAQSDFKIICEEIQGSARTKIAGSRRMTDIASCFVNHSRACATTSDENFEYDFGSPEMTQEVLDNTPGLTKTQGIKPMHQKIIEFCNGYGWIATCYRLDEGYNLECMVPEECSIDGAYEVEDSYCMRPNNQFRTE